MSNITSALVKELRELTNAAMMDCKKALTEAAGDLEKARDILRKNGQLIVNKKAGRKTKEGKILIKPSADGKKVAMVQLTCETDFVARNENFEKCIQTFADLALKSEKKNFFDRKDSSEKSPNDLLSEAIAHIGENMILAEPAISNIENGQILGTYTHTNNKIGVTVLLKAKKTPETESLAKDICMHIAASNVQSISEKDLDPKILKKEKELLIEQSIESGKPKEIAEKMVIGRLQKFKKEICLLDQAFIKDTSMNVTQVIENTGKNSGSPIEVLSFHKFSI